MSKIFDLINELCPNGVEFKALGDICELERGNTITSKDINDGDIPVISGGQRPAYYHNEYNRDGETITIAGSGAYAGFIMYWNRPIFVADAFSIKSQENRVIIKFVYHFLLSKQEKIYNMKQGAGIPHVYAKDVSKIKLPVPPMEVQREIVRILDSFTSVTEELMAKLTAELIARKKQYEFYRDFLLSFDELDKNGGGYELKMLGEICDLIAGGDISKDKVSKEKDIKFKFPIYSNGIGDNALYGFTDEPRVMKQCVTISARGTIGYCALRLDPFYPIVRLICAIPKSNIAAQFLKYFLDTQKISVPTSGIPQLTIPMVAKIKIPVPSLQTQQKVVDILDKFDTLVNSITEGLPREIELRRKQYEYYRELLLNFKPKMRA